MKKAVILSLASFITAMLIFSLAIVVFHNTQKSKERFSESVISDRVFDLFTSTENSVKEIFIWYFPLNVTIIEKEDWTDVSFKENITRYNKTIGKDFKKYLDKFIDYIEENEPHITIEPAKIKGKKFVLTILPHNIEYSRFWKKEKGYIEVKPKKKKKKEQENFSSYDVIINTNDLEITEVDDKFGRKGEFNFTVAVTDNFGHNIIKGKLVDPKKKSEVKIELENGGGEDVMVKLDDLKLEIWTKTEEPITVTTTVDQLESLGEKVSVEYLGTVITANFSEFNISKNNTIKIA